MWRPLFPVGEVVSTDDLVGRDDVIANIMRTLSVGRNVLMVAPRRMGKTSVVHEALLRLSREGHLTALVDVAECAAETFAERLINAVLANGSRGPRTLKDLVQMLRSASLSVKLPLLGAGSESIEFAVNFLGLREGGRPDIGTALDFAEEYARRAGKQLVLALDEFQAAQRFSRRGVDVLSAMRAHMIWQRSVRYIFLGSQAGMLQSIFNRESQPFFRLAAPVDLPPIPPAAWHEYIIRKFATRQINAAEIAAPLVELTGAHPLDTMILASNLLVLAEEAGLRLLLPSALQEAYHISMQELRNLFVGQWSDRSVVEQAVLRAIGRGRAGYGQQWHPNEVRGALRQLTDDGVIRKVGRGDYRFVEAFFAQWVRTTQLDPFLDDQRSGG